MEDDLSRFRAAMDMSGDAIYLVDRSTMRFVDVNQTACARTGYSRAEMLAMGPQDLLKRDRRSIERDYDAVIAAGDEGVTSESAAHYKDGSQSHAELHRRALCTDKGWIIVSIARDISLRKRTEEALRDSEERFRSLIRLSSDFYWETDAAHRLSVITHGSLHRGILPKGSQIGRTRWELPFTSPDETGWAAHREVLDARQTFRNFQFARLGLDGKERHLAITGEPVLDGAGAFRGYRGIGSDITDRVQAERRIEHLATHDELTGLPNRAMFAEVLELAVASARRHGRRLALLFIDLDRFKSVNDTFGHEAGDALLKRVATRMKECVRSSDVVARIGGDEFVVLVHEAAADGLAAVARKMVAGVAETVDAGGPVSGVTASVGISIFPTDARDPNELMAHADRAMYVAKERGRNIFRFFSADER